MRSAYYLLRIINGQESPLVQIVSSSHTEKEAERQLAMTRERVDPEMAPYRIKYHYRIWEDSVHASDQHIKEHAIHAAEVVPSA